MFTYTGLINNGENYTQRFSKETAPAPAAAVSEKASSGDILGTKRGTIDPLVSKQPEKNSE